MTYWLVKSEPQSWSWADQEKAGSTDWSGVRNPQATANLRAMRRGDRAFFYHSGEERRIVGIVEVTREFYADPKDASGRFGMVDVRTVAALPRPVTLAAIKAEPELSGLQLVRQSRLSVVPIDAKAWSRLCRMGGVTA
jgi:predicted RNA-binding protein with PUA-like domain